MCLSVSEQGEEEPLLQAQLWPCMKQTPLFKWHKVEGIALPSIRKPDKDYTFEKIKLYCYFKLVWEIDPLEPGGDDLII